EVRAQENGRVLWVSTEGGGQGARAAGAPREKGAGSLRPAQPRDAEEKGHALCEVYADRSGRPTAALEMAEKLEPTRLSTKDGERMLLDRFPPKTTPPRRESHFMLER